MDVIGFLLNVLKGVNLKYQKDDSNHNIDMSLNDETTNLEGTLSIKVGKDKKSEVSATFGKDEDK